VILARLRKRPVFSFKIAFYEKGFPFSDEKSLFFGPPVFSDFLKSQKSDEISSIFVNF